MEDNKLEVSIIEIDTQIESVLKIDEAIKITPASIQWNIPKENFINSLEKLKLEASKIKVTRADISKRKKDRASLNKGRDAIRDLVKGKIEESMSAINELTAFGKQAVALVVDASKMLDDQIKAIEEVDKNNKRQTIELEIERLMQHISLEDKYKAMFVFDEKWLNATASLIETSKEAEAQITNLFNQQEAEKAKLQARIHLIEKYNEIYNFSFTLQMFRPESYSDEQVLEIYQTNVTKRQADMDRRIAQEKAKIEQEAKERELRELEQKRQEAITQKAIADTPSISISNAQIEQVKSDNFTETQSPTTDQENVVIDSNFEEFTIKVKYDKTNQKHVDGIAKIMAWFEKENTGVRMY